MFEPVGIVWGEIEGGGIRFCFVFFWGGGLVEDIG